MSRVIGEAAGAMELPSRCNECRFAVLKDYGYSNYTIEGTYFRCAKRLHPAGCFDQFYGEDPRLDYGKECAEFGAGEPVEMDVDEEKLPLLSPEHRAIWDMDQAAPEAPFTLGKNMIPIPEPVQAVLDGWGAKEAMVVTAGGIRGQAAVYLRHITTEIDACDIIALCQLNKPVYVVWPTGQCGDASRLVKTRQGLMKANFWLPGEKP